MYDKLVRLGPAYTESASTAEAVQVCVEGTEQPEGYFGAYAPQLFYAVLAPLTLFACLAPLCLPAAVALLLCVPLIPASIVAVQKIAKRVMGEYWGAYTDLGATFLENLQGLATLKIFQADEVALVCREVGYAYDGECAVLQDVNFEAPAADAGELEEALDDGAALAAGERTGAPEALVAASRDAVACGTPDCPRAKDFGGRTREADGRPQCAEVASTAAQPTAAAARDAAAQPSHLSVMAGLVSLVKPLVSWMVLAVILGVLGFGAAIFLTVFGMAAITNAAGFPGARRCARA